MEDNGTDLVITAPTDPLADEALARLEKGLSVCPDVAFAHLVEVRVDDQETNMVLFAWLQPRALESLRSALDLVSRAVATSLPNGAFVDVVILNSAPDLLAQVEAADCLLVEIDPEERQRALSAAQEAPEPPLNEAEGSPWWWPFGR